MERENTIFEEEKTNREGKGGKYIEKENIFLRRRRKTENEEEENIWIWIFFWGRRKIAKEKEESIWRRKIFGTQWIRRTEKENLLENPSHDA